MYHVRFCGWCVCSGIGFGNRVNVLFVKARIVCCVAGRRAPVCPGSPPSSEAGTETHDDDERIAGSGKLGRERRGNEGGNVGHKGDRMS